MPGRLPLSASDRRILIVRRSTDGMEWCVANGFRVIDHRAGGYGS
jgi:hypothetical protein